MKILITSDNHLGYKEKDDIRGKDSFDTFEEILMLANEHNVDFILQGGDLFHDNRPSRYCIDKTIQLLSKYCTGTDRTNIKEISKLNKSTDSVSISIPMLAIHGNHDDPSGLNRISTLNILHSAGLISYIGKYNSEKIIVEPIIIQNISLYAIGHIKDRILHSCFVEGRVVFKKPENYKNYYNILIIHQNRVQRNKEYIPESILDDFFDLVIYGHEHDSSITKGRFVVLQNGSTVRTSLCDSETGDKYCYILDVEDSQTKTLKLATVIKMKLHTVRNFVMDTIKVEDENFEATVENYLSNMIDKANAIYKNNMAKFKALSSEAKLPKKHKASKSREDFNTTRIVEEPSYAPVDFSDKNLHLPLIRLRVETTGLKVLNNHKMGLNFKQKVANPTDMIRFIRKKTVVNNVSNVPEASTSQDIYEILKSNLCNLTAIPEEKFIDSLECFVDKDDKESFNNMIKENVDRLVEKIDLGKILLDDVENEIKRINREEFGKVEDCPILDSLSDEEIIKSFENTEDNVETIKDKAENNNISLMSNFGTNNSNIFTSENNNEKIDVNCKNNSILNNTSFLTSASSAIFKDLSYETPNQQSFSGKNSKEARKVINSMSFKTNIHNPSTNNYNNKPLAQRRILIDDNENNMLAQDEKTVSNNKNEQCSSLEESSTDLLFDF
ncbi:Double-strand break repair protein MRE11 [Nosema granulosis]|uniref:Double-strand break repair protein n=1 Tax=Nosema granulosis TaxID=83296 RepID=A0A9P6GYV6_9MICR|nr:Double-strand break repair protein MRE11 [Nosema granulosis]